MRGNETHENQRSTEFHRIQGTREPPPSPPPRRRGRGEEAAYQRNPRSPVRTSGQNLVTLFSIPFTANNHQATSKPLILLCRLSGETLPLSPRERARVRGNATLDNPRSPHL